MLQERETIRLKREAKAKQGFYVQPEAKLAFVMRIRGLNKIHPKVGAHAACTGLVPYAPPPPHHSLAAALPSCCLLQTKKILQLLRLRQINNAVFVRVSSAQEQQHPWGWSSSVATTAQRLCSTAQQGGGWMPQSEIFSAEQTRKGIGKQL
jgi:ribosomal protein L30/L7E